MPRIPSGARLSHGLRAERLVALWLQRRGYAIVATNLRLGHLEIDIVARQGPVIAIVEVRLRGEGAWTTPFGSVERMRFDVASVKLVDGKPVIEHALGAF